MEGNRHDDLLQDDASIEILSESGDSRTRDCEWSIYSLGRSSISSIAESDMRMMDFQKLSIHSKMAKIVHQDGQQFIERRDLDDGGLPYSAEFYLNGEVWKLNGEDCVLMSSRRFIAMVNVEGTIIFDRAVGFEEGVRTLLKHLRVEKVLLDKELEECTKTKSILEMTLDTLTDESGGNINRRRDVMLLYMLLRKHGNSLSMDFKHDLRNCSRLSSEIMSTLDNYVTKTLKLIQRNEFLGHLNDSSLSDQFINDAIQEALNSHRAQLATICLSSMKDKLLELPDDRILYVSVDDMHLFKDLTTLDEAVLPMIFSKFLTRVQEISVEQFADADPLSNRIFLYVCKSIQEVAEELNTHNAIIYSATLGWEVTNLQEEFPFSYREGLRQQLQMLAKLANHFEPGGPFRTSRFPYDFKVFQYMDAIPEPVRIWLCLLDDCMKNLVQVDLDKMQMLSCFFQSYVSFVASEEFRSETLECLRTITSGALRSLAYMASSQQDRNTSESASVEYNQMISCCLGKFPREHFGNECDQIETMLQQIICKAMDMDVSSDELSKFFNVFKLLLNDLSDLPLEWLVRLTPSDKRNFLLRKHFIVPVDSIWKDFKDECCKVVDLEGFIEMYKLLYNSEEMPKHYQLKKIQVLLQNFHKLVEKQASKQSGNDGKPLSDKDLLDDMTAAINSIRSSPVLLKEQPDYCLFEHFRLNMSKPVEAIKEEKHELDYTDVIDSDETLDPLQDRFESSISTVFLRNDLKIYTTQFNKHIVETVRLSRDKKIEKIVSDVKSKIDPKLVTSWTEEFKRNELPEVLAGLSAVWSIIVSENDSSSKKMTKPSHLQIFCVLRIFGDQKNHTKDDSHQLLQLTTQEGKEFVLGLTAALLALHGHKIEIACFNSHLTRLNSVNWIEVFKSFSILFNISYESLEDMAWEQSKEVYEKYMAYINKCFGFEANASNDNEPKNASEDERSVLLIEDIDIILQENIRNRCLRWFIRPNIPGLEEVQRKLFCQNEPVDGNEIDEYINQSGNPNIKELRAFLDRPHSYKILEGDPIEEVEYTNKSLFLKHLEAFKEAKSMQEYYSGFPQTVTDCNKYGYLSLGYIFFSCEYLLKSFPLVLGFTIAPVARSDEKILNNLYGVYHKIFESDVFQTIPTNFDSKKDFLYTDSTDEWIESIIVAIQAAIDRNCLVLVFFKGAQQMDLLRQNEYLKQMNTTAIKTASSRVNLSGYAISNDEISVLMVCNGHFAKDRQVHVIQTFFSEDGKEEALIRRQAEQSHSSGSYELIIPRISTYPGKEEITYDWLVKKRQYFTAEEINHHSAFSYEQCHRMKRFLRLCYEL